MSPEPINVDIPKHMATGGTDKLKMKKAINIVYQYMKIYYIQLKTMKQFSGNVYRTYIKYNAPFCQRGRASNFPTASCAPGTQKQQNGASMTIDANPASI